METLATLFAGLLTMIGGWFSPQPEPTLGAFGDPFLSIQVGTTPANGECLTTDGTNSVWDSCSSGAVDITGGTSLGTGLNIFDSESAGILRFNSVAAGTNITLSTTSNSNTIVINSTGGGGSFPFTPDAYGGIANNSTTTGLWIKPASGYGLVASSTFTTYASTTQLSVSGNTYLPSLTSALVLAGSAGLLAEYTGIDCTNQFVRDVGADVAGTCATVGSADVAGLDSTDISGLDISDDTNLAATWPSILTGDTLSFGGLSTSTAAVQGNLPYFSGVNTFANVATNTASCSGNTTCTPFTVIAGGAVTISSTGGGTGLSTTSPTANDQVLVYNSVGAGAAYSIATTSLSITGPFIIPSAIGVLKNGAVTYTGLATTSAVVQGNLFYSSGGAGVANVATTTLTATGPLSLSQPVVKVGGSNSVLTIATTTNSLFTGTQGQVLTYTDLGWTGVATTTFSGGVAFANGNVTNTLTAGDGLTRNTDDFDLDIPVLVASGGTGLTSYTGDRLFYSNDDGTAIAFAATSTLNVGTATALAANGANCGAGFFPLGVDASGASESCTYAFATTTPWAANQIVYLNNVGQAVTAASSTLFGSATPGYVWSYQNGSAGWYATSSVAGSGYATVQDEGSPLTQRTTLNFTGSPITCSDSGGITVCDVTGGSSKWTDAGTYIYPTTFTDRVHLGTSTENTAFTTLTVAATSTGTGYLADFVDSTSAKLFRFSTTSVMTIGVAGTAGDAFTQYGSNPFAWAVGFDDTDDSFAISSSTVLGTSNALTIAKSNLNATFGAGLTVTGAGVFSSTLNTVSTVDFDAYTSALLLTGAGGILAEYAGAAACTNQFVTALDALGATTCASINNAQWSGTDLAVANGGTGLSTFGGTNTILYTTGTDILASEAGFTYDQTPNRLTVDFASTTALSASSLIISGGRMMFGTTTSNLLAGITIGTSTVLKFAQFSNDYASSSAQAASYTVNWDTGNTQRYILNQNTNFVINSTSSNPRDGGKYVLKICQDTTGSRTATFVTPGQLVWSSQGTTTVGSAAGQATLIGMIYDGRTQRYDITASSTMLNGRSCQP